ncbi:cilia- and flagella-associated protein 206 [Rhincodon typus]|uniref:cilia- and flagella-associated protein 206 n=1 Tax=Rhincodon typus TaxID=259920 RepID=UPI00203033DA|nr:cilia- and flagella-associated protein 206 [Rhincodon typus]
MAYTQAECVIKNIIREIAQECADRGHSISETLVAFMVKAVVLDPRYEFNVEKTLTKTDVRKLITTCVDRLLETQRSSLDTIKMQVYFDMNYTSRAEFLAEHRTVLESRLAPVCREITDSRARTRDELECLYRKIVSYMLLHSGLGSPTEIGVVREATAALQSVFPQVELGTFLALTKKDKERQLNELSMIVTGIRLFNKNCKKGGEGIDDLPAILNEAVPATKQNVESELQATQQLIYHYTAIIERLEKSRAQWYEEDGFHDKLKEALYNVRQHEVFLHIIVTEIVTCAKQVELLEHQLERQMLELNDVVKSKAAVPTAQVYPHFIALSNLWTAFQDELVLLSVFSNLVTNLDPYLATHSQLFPDGVIGPLLEGVVVKTDAQRLSEVSGQRINPSDFKNREWVFPEDRLAYCQPTLQYRGFCAYTFGARHGLLLRGNPNVGILKYQEKYYAFSSKEAASAFAQKPDCYIAMAAEEAKHSAELIQLLELHQQFSTITPYTQADRCLKSIEKFDSCTQTDTHILEPNIVKSYEWNEWELRRKAIKLANLRQKVTRYIQTNLSHMRRDNTSQVYLPKDQSVQTKRESSSNVPKPQVFYAGLRGGNITEPTHVIKYNLTRAIDET